MKNLNMECTKNNKSEPRPLTRLLLVATWPKPPADIIGQERLCTKCEDVPPWQGNRLPEVREQQKLLLL